tara:strand:+ start:251 stop:484 length:234 start_codon:yes stop_codon:yes gene_type:complete
VILNLGAHISGGVSVGKFVLIGANSVIYQNIIINEYVDIDANTLVYSNIELYKLCTSRNIKILTNYKKLTEAKKWKT